MSLDLAALKDEINTNPKALGYASLVTAQNYQGLADMLNVGSDGKAAGPASETLPLDRVKASDAIAFLLRTELQALTAQDREYITNITNTGELVFHHDKAKSAQNLNGTTQLLVELLTIFPSTTVSGATLRALINRPCSRVETLFGAGVRVTHNDVAQALGS
jgi:hypothetical protein